MYFAQFITIAIVHLLAVMSPGPDFAIVTRNSLIYSRKIAIFTSLGVALGILVHVAYTLLGIGLLISQSILFFTIIKYVGALYLMYIGIMSLKSKPEINKEETFQKKGDLISIRKAVWNGFLTNVLNPKATLFFLALFTQVVNPETPKLIQAGYGIEMMIMTFAWFGLLSVFFSHALFKNKILKYKHYIDRVTGVVLIALGIKVALSSQK